MDEISGARLLDENDIFLKLATLSKRSFAIKAPPLLGASLSF